MHKRKIAGSAAWALLAHLLSRGSLMIAAIVLARSLDPRSLASYGYFQLTATLIATYASMGLGATAVKVFAEVASDSAEHEGAIAGMWVFSLAASAIAAAVVLILPSQWVTADLEVSQSLLAVTVGLMVLSVVPNGAMVGLECYRQAAVIAFFSGVLLLVGASVAASSNSLSIAIYSLIGSTLIQCVGQVTVVLRALDWRLLAPGKVSATSARAMAGFAGPMFVVSLMSGSATWIVGRLILADSNGAYEFAVYSIGLQWFALGLLFPGMFSRVLMPMLVRHRARSASAIGSDLTLVRAGLQLACISSMLVATIGAIFGHWMFAIYGSNYRTEGWLIGAFLFCAVLYSPVNVLGNAIIVRNGQLAWLGLTAVWFLILVGMPLGAISLGWFVGAAQGAVFQAISAGVLAVLAFAMAKARGLI